MLLLWLIPVVAGLWLAIPMVVLSGSETVGQWLLRHGLLVIEEERVPPPVLRRLEELTGTPAPATAASERFVRTVMDPRANALHIDLLQRRRGRRGRWRRRPCSSARPCSWARPRSTRPSGVRSSRTYR